MLSEGYSENKSVIQRWDVTVINDQTPVKPCESQEEAIWINGKHAGHRVYICRDKDCKIHRSGNSSRSGAGGGDAASERETRKKLLVKVNAEKRYRNALFNAVAAAPVTESLASQFATDAALYCIGRMTSIYNKKLAEALGWDVATLGYGVTAKLREKLLTLTLAERLRAAVLASHMNDIAVQEYSMGSKDYRPKGFEQMATYLSVDMKALRSAADNDPKQKAATEPAIAKAAKPEPAKKTPVNNATATAPKAAKKPAPKKGAKSATKKTTKAKK
jgi:hypothetical protein